MEILTLLGSPRLKGNTAAVLAAFEEKARAIHNVTRINVIEHDIRGCLGCDYCQRHPDSPRCAQKDEANVIFEQMMRADTLVYATALYMWDFTAQMKALLDRHFCLTKWQGDQVAKSYLAGKRAMLLVTCGSEIEGNADLIPVVFQREMDCADVTVAGVHILPGCSTPAETRRRMGPLVAAMLGCLN